MKILFYEYYATGEGISTGIFVSNCYADNDVMKEESHKFYNAYLSSGSEIYDVSDTEYHSAIRNLCHKLPNFVAKIIEDEMNGIKIGGAFSYHQDLYLNLS